MNLLAKKWLLLILISLFTGGITYPAPVSEKTSLIPAPQIISRSAENFRVSQTGLSDDSRIRKAPRSPEPVSADRKGDMVIVSFRYSGRLKTSVGLPLREVEVSESGHDFKAATARIRGNRLEINAPGAMAVRYGWKP